MSDCEPLAQDVTKTIMEKFPFYNYDLITSSKYIDTWYDVKTSHQVRHPIYVSNYAQHMTLSRWLPSEKHRIVKTATFRDLIEEAARKRFSDILFIAHWVYYGSYGDNCFAYYISRQCEFPFKNYAQQNETLAELNAWFLEFSVQFAGVYYLDESQNPPKLLLESELDAHPLKTPVHIINTADPAKPIVIHVLSRDFDDFCRVSQYLAELHTLIKN